MTKNPSRRPPAWAILLAFALLYLSWGTTFLAIREGVHAQQLPPALFGGTRVGLAGCLLLLFLAARGDALRLPRRDLRTVTVSGLLLFVGGNGLLTVAEKTVASGAASIFVTTTPLWMALLELCWPRGERLNGRGWLGLSLGLAGVLGLLAPRLQQPADLFTDPGPLLILGSAAAWSLGSLVVRHGRVSGPHLAAAAYQMIIGGVSLSLIGLALGEARQLTPEQFNWRAGAAFFYLLIVGSLVGFVAFNWLLGHVSAALVGTYAYVNPLIALLVGWLVGGEELTGRVVVGMVVILAGVALVRKGIARRLSRDREGAGEVHPAPSRSRLSTVAAQHGRGSERKRKLTKH
jgi:drug/metabolite transporter (DMT)-like permease